LPGISAGDSALAADAAEFSSGGKSRTVSTGAGNAIPAAGNAA
jgi:hypothetical protein